MLTFDAASQSALDKVASSYPPSSNASARSSESREKLPLPDQTGVLVTEIDNVAHEAKTKVEKALHAVTVQLARWGLEVNG